MRPKAAHVVGLLWGLGFVVGVLGWVVVSCAFYGASVASGGVFLGLCVVCCFDIVKKKATPLCGRGASSVGALVFEEFDHVF